jgi:two-component system cell cycle response regulator
MTKSPQQRRGGMNRTQASLDKPASTRIRIPVKPPIVERALAEPPATVRILLAEDSAVYRQLISGHLNDWGFDLVIAKDGAEAWTCLQAPDAPRLALLDWVLPQVEGIELCRRIRQAEAGTHYSYIVLLTGKDGENDLLEGMKAGADDYLVKPFKPLELKARLLAGKRILDLHEELVDGRESLRIAATYDFLTLLLNRGEILTLLDRELNRGWREITHVGIILADIDHFKNVNDSLGHLAGDIVLKEVANRLKSDLRIYDGVGRYGGEEFLMILPGCDLATTIRRAEAIRHVVAATEITTAEGTVRATVSMGVTSTQHHKTSSVESLLNEADLALYRAKENGRDRVEAYVQRPPTIPATIAGTRSARSITTKSR